MARRLPERFLLGCATSAYQVEGGIDNDWAAWAEAGRLKDPKARCGRASDHWARWRADFDLLSELGANAYRFSVEWARVEPEPGVYDEAALAQYGQMAADLRARGIEPCVTLLHFTHPRWFHEQCPWHDLGNDATARFGRFVERVLEALGGHARLFTVLNEPAVWLAAAYLRGVVPPGRKGLRELASAGAHLLQAHAGAAARIRAAVPDARIGVAHNIVRFAPDRPAHPGDKLAASYAHRAFNLAIPSALTSGRWQLGVLPGVRQVHDIEGLAGSVDFLGVNYYSRVFVRSGLTAPRLQVFYEDRDGRGVTDLGWEVYPEGMQLALQQMARFGLPLYVTENGLDDRSDTRRSAHLYDHLDQVLAAVEAGIDVRGYFHWSLMDNFEWLEAFGPRFGLYRVDYETYARTPTRAAALFSQIAAQRALPSRRPDQTKRPGQGRTPVE